MAKIPEAPVSRGQQRLRDFLAGNEVLFEPLERNPVQVEMGVRVVAELEVRRDPPGQKRDPFGVA